jgi:hypothetical protein
MKRPLVLTASKPVIEQARALGVERPLENIVETSILAGRLPPTKVGRKAEVQIGDRIVAVCAKVRIESGRKAWRILVVRRPAERRAA